MDKNKTLNNVKRAINALPLNQAYRDSLNNTFKELVDNSGSDPSGGGSNGEGGIYILNLPEFPENNEPFENQNKIAKDIIKAIDENKQIVVKYSMEDEGTKFVQWNNINSYTYTLFEDYYTITLTWGITMPVTGESMFEFTHCHLILTNDNCYFEQKTARLESID